jgi:hypothetical protein
MLPAFHLLKCNGCLLRTTIIHKNALQMQAVTKARPAVFVLHQVQSNSVREWSKDCSSFEFFIIVWMSIFII